MSVRRPKTMLNFSDCLVGLSGLSIYGSRPHNYGLLQQKDSKIKLAKRNDA